MQKQLMTSNRDDWQTPRELFRRLDRIFSFDLDAAASLDNALCSNYISKEMDALKTNWQVYQDTKVFLNPPYSKRLVPWFEKILEEYKKGVTIVVLVAARTDTQWHQIAWDYARYFCFLKGRLKFELNGRPVKDSATFPSEIIVFSPHGWNLESLKEIGHVIVNEPILNPKLQSRIEYEEFINDQA